MNIQELKESWKDTPEYHKMMHQAFINTAKDTYLSEHRNWCRNHVFGFGEDSFPFMWFLLVNESPDEFTFCEIGCFKFQTVTLIRLIADKLGKKVKRVCVSPMDGSGGLWDEDYFAHAKTIHEHFNIPQDYILCHGLSQNAGVISKALSESPFDILYVDGGHKYEEALFDLTAYSEMIKVGGYLAIDDAGCKLNNPGHFPGIQPVCDAMEDWLKSTDDFEFQFNVMHIMVFKRIK